MQQGAAALVGRRPLPGFFQALLAAALLPPPVRGGWHLSAPGKGCNEVCDQRESAPCVTQVLETQEQAAFVASAVGEVCLGFWPAGDFYYNGSCSYYKAGASIDWKQCTFFPQPGTNFQKFCCCGQAASCPVSAPATPAPTQPPATPAPPAAPEDPEEGTQTQEPTAPGDPLPPGGDPTVAPPPPVNAGSVVTSTVEPAWTTTTTGLRIATEVFRTVTLIYRSAVSHNPPRIYRTSSTVTATGTTPTSTLTTPTSTRTTLTSTRTTLTSTRTTPTSTRTTPTSTRTSLTSTSTWTTTSATSTVTSTRTTLTRTRTTLTSSRTTLTSTLSTTTTSTTTTTVPSLLPDASAAAESLLRQEDNRATGLLAGLDEDQEENSAPMEHGGKIAARRLKKGEGPQKLRIELLDMEVQVPAELVSSLGGDQDVALVVAAYGTEDPDVRGLGGHSKGINVLGACAISIRGVQDKKERSVKNLAEPIEFSLPANYTPGMSCGWWDEEAKRWSEAGVTTVPQNEVGGLLRCATTHLSLFGALMRGAQMALTCTNLALFSAEALGRLFDMGAWGAGRGALLFWLLLLLLTVLAAAAVVLDMRRARKSPWGDELLVATEQAQMEAETKEKLARQGSETKLGRQGSMRRPGSAESMGGTPSTVSTRNPDSVGTPSVTSRKWTSEASSRRMGSAESLWSPCSPEDVRSEGAAEGTVLPLMACSSLCCGCSCCAMGHGESRGVIFKALQEVAGAWFAPFSDVVSVVKSGLPHMNADAAAAGCGLLPGHLGEVRQRAAENVLMFNSRRAAAAYMGVSQETVRHVLEHKALVHYFMEEQAEERVAGLEGLNQLMMVRKASRGSMESGGSGSTARSYSSWRTQSSQRSAWKSLRSEVLEQMLRSTCGQRPLQAFVACSKLNPLGDLFAECLLRTCKQRALLLAAELLGSFAFCCLFFKSAGLYRQGSGCGESREPVLGESVGRFVVVALASLLVAGLPVLLLKSLMTKSFRKLEDHEAMRMQLDTWRLQEKIYWALGAAYIGLCVAYILLFLANIEEEAHSDWSLAAACALLQELLLLPLLTSVVVPTLAKALLLLHTWLSGIAQEDFVKQACLGLYRKVMMPVEDV